MCPSGNEPIFGEKNNDKKVLTVFNKSSNFFYTTKFVVCSVSVLSSISFIHFNVLLVGDMVA